MGRIPKHLFLHIDGDEIDIQADTVILAAGACGDLSLADTCRELGYETHVAGDCIDVTYIEGAIRTGHAVGRNL